MLSQRAGAYVQRNMYAAIIHGIGVLSMAAGCYLGMGLSVSYPETAASSAAACSNSVATTDISSRATGPLSFAEECGLKAKDRFKECELCPEMVVVPAGSFEMGASESETAELLASGRYMHPSPSEVAGYELPRHVVRFATSFAVSRFPVTFEEWDACVADGGCGGYRPTDSGGGLGRRPVTSVSWDDAQAYLAWLSRKTGRRYRLLSEAEWEYTARAGTTSSRPNYDTKYLTGQRTVPVDSFEPNPWGVYQANGNLQDWVEDCWNAGYEGAPADGSAWTNGHCAKRVLRGGSRPGGPESLRWASRSFVGASAAFLDLGFRVARALGPRVAIAAAPADSTRDTSDETNRAGRCLPSPSSEKIAMFARRAQPLSHSEECTIEPKESFRECEACPEMVVVPAGSFLMGAPDREATMPAHRPAVRFVNPRRDWPQHPVNFKRPFAVGRFSVTFDEWDACVEDGGCTGYKPSDLGWGRGRQPVINVSWDDAKAYVSWLSRKTGKPYRLLSEAEREYVTRAGTTTAYWWGFSITDEQAVFTGTTATGLIIGPKKAMPVDTFEPNPWGLYQVHGNVWDWVEDCWDDRTPHAPADGSARTAGQCTQRILRGGSWADDSYFLRSGRRYVGFFAMRSDNIGFRVARTIAH